MALSNTTTLTSVINAEFIAKTQLCANAVSVFAPGGPGRQFLAVEDLTGRATKVASWPVEPAALTAYAVAEGTDHSTSQSITPTDTTATVAEYVAITTITDLAADVSLENEKARARRFLGYAHGNKIDSVVMALFNALDTDVGSSGNPLTYLLLTNAPNTLGANNFDGPYGAVIHNQQWYDLINEGTPNIGDSASPLGERVRTNWGVFQVAGIAPIVVSPNVPTANTAADRSGAVFSGSPALGLAELGFLMLAEERDESLRALEITSVSRYAAVEIRGAAAVALETDA